MRTLALAVAAIGVIFLVPRTTRAQTCCGDSTIIPITCPFNNCTDYVYQCNRGAGDMWMGVLSRTCGTSQSCGRVTSFMTLGSGCDAAGGAPAQGSPEGNPSVEAIADVDAYVKGCDGKYVAVRVAIRRQAA